MLALSFAAYIASLKLLHFTAAELFYRSERPELRALWHEPERGLWPNIALTAIIADRLRHEVGLPMRISSAWRPSAYNLHRWVKGGKKSQHQVFAALDLQVIALNPDTGVFRWNGHPNRDGLGDHRHLAELVRSWRGELFRVPGIHHRRQGGTELHGLCPFKELPTWTNGSPIHPDDTPRSQVVEFHGGVGDYKKFVHIDTRGFNATWSGA